ncbi:MAG: glycosyl transferase [Candidatus Latescibacteria bacterium]|nr:glycosyl transferase [Candidatus Latescibacterota bacterium]
MPRIPDPRRPTPPAALLAAAGTTTLITAHGTGFTARNGVNLTLWRGDHVTDRDGWFFYIRDRETFDHWILGIPGPYGSLSVRRAIREPGVFTIEHEQAGVAARLEVCIAPDGCEVRRVTLTNRSGQRRWLDLTTAAEVVLAPAAAHASHPVFSNLFLQTEFDAESRSLLVRRRPRGADEIPPWLVLADLGDDLPEYETDRHRFLGRGRNLLQPAALNTSGPLSGTTGNVLDPVIALRRTLTLDPDESVSCSFLLGAARDRDAALALVVDRAGRRSAATTFAGAREQARLDLRSAGLTTAEASYLQDLAGAMLYGDPRLRAAPEALARATAGPEDLDRLGLDGDPLGVVLDARSGVDPVLRAKLRAAVRYWRTLGLETTLIELAAGGTADGDVDGVRTIPPGDLSSGDLDLVLARARLVVRDRLPDLAVAPAEPAAVAAWPRAATTHAAPPPLPDAAASLKYWNGFGGFAPDGREYVIRLVRGRDGRLVLPPQPWVNVVANEAFGFLVGETGAGAVWSVNSRQRRLTPWANDPVGDPHDESFFVRDEDDGVFWSCLPGPRPGEGDYEMRHGFGYSRCLHESRGLALDTLLFVARDKPVRFVRVGVTNRGPSLRRLSVFAHSRLVLGDRPASDGRQVVTGRGDTDGLLFARNRQAGAHAQRTVFGAVIAGETAHLRACGDRASFLGDGGAPSDPEVLRRGDLEGRVGAGLDACFTHQATFELKPGESLDVVVLLGDAADADGARDLAAAMAADGAWRREFAAVDGFWRGLLSAVQVSTPAPALDLMVNGWLPYQTLSCRIWGRTALYQSGGAFGFRDQLQDASSLAPLWPAALRGQILLHAGHQFREGDVLHWWHTPDDRGLRTRFADDLLWLPLLAADYVRATGDRGVMAAVAPFLDAPALDPGEDERFVKAVPSGESADLYDHCCRALDRSLAVGAHGLPLFGCGDWNDGMNRVGREGRGESVWMAFFLCAVIEAFAPFCDERGDDVRARRYRDHAARLRESVEHDGWDGAWYRRGYYDDGAPLGTAGDSECRIDALAQSWSVLSGAARPDRAAAALDAVERHLVDEEHGLIRLLAPPFVDTPHDPGYIKGYVAGVRENGGQYTHAALWYVRAVAEAGRNNRALALLEAINPVNLSDTAARVAVYQVEPYVVAADVYGAAPHVGRGGWTWYTGSSGWMHRTALESILGFRLAGGDAFELRPCVPDDWPRYGIAWRAPDGATTYDIEVLNPDGRARGVVAATLDGAPLACTNGGVRVPVACDGRAHRVEAILGDVPGSAS